VTLGIWLMWQTAFIRTVKSDKRYFGTSRKMLRKGNIVFEAALSWGGKRRQVSSTRRRNWDGIWFDLRFDLQRLNYFFRWKKCFVYKKSLKKIYILKTLMCNGEHSRNQMVLYFLDFDDWAARSRQVVSKSFKKSLLHIMSPLATSFWMPLQKRGRRARGSRLQLSIKTTLYVNVEWATKTWVCIDKPQRTQ
jgi:hypothetical protein